MGPRDGATKFYRFLAQHGDCHGIMLLGKTEWNTFNFTCYGNCIDVYQGLVITDHKENFQSQVRLKEKELF